MRFLMLVLTDPELSEPQETPLTIQEWVEEAYGSARAVEGDRLRPTAEASDGRERRDRAASRVAAGSLIRATARRPGDYAR
jgi:hypothetical protein